MTIVDALVVTLGLDASAFKRGKSEASTATKKLTAEERAAAKEIEERNKKAAESFRRIRTEVLALAALFTAGMGIKEFAQSTIDSAANLGFMAKNLQMSTRDLSAWQRAAQLAGGSADGITAALQASQGDVSKLKFGQMTEGVQWFLRMGGSVNDLKDGNTYLLARSRIIKRMFDVDPGRARFVAQAMGIGDDEFNFLRQGPQAVLALVEAQKKNSAITAQQAAQAQELRKEWLELQFKLQSVATTILLDLMPTFQKWIGELQKASDWVADHKDDISQWLDETNKDVTKFVDLANESADAVGGWKNVIIGLGALKILSIATPLLRLASALGGVGKGLAAVSLAGPAALGVLARVIGAAALLLHSENLNEGEGNTRLTQPGDTWDGDPIGQQRRGGPGKDPKAQAAVQRLMAMGWTKEQASGLVANMWQESLLNPKAVGDNGNAYGIGQWHEDRQAAFRKLFGIDIRQSTLDQQLQFANYELTQGNERPAGDRLRSVTNALDAGAIVSRYYERPGKKDDPSFAEKEAQRRAGIAADLYASLGQANAARIATQSAAAAAPASRGSTTTNTSHAETHVNGPINIHTQATDAAGIARDFGNAMKRYSFVVPHANTGMS